MAKSKASPSASNPSASGTLSVSATSSLLEKRPAPQSAKDKRDVKEVPFVELFDGRLQGVVSSGSDIQRVYVSYFEVGTLNYSCNTNNNRPCGGLRGHPCNHLRELLHEAVIQYGLDQVVHFLRIPGDPRAIQSDRDILGRAGKESRVFVGEIFSRFLSDLELLELPGSASPLSAMAWFND
ncbi:MAG TPA: hypothetical protein VHL11_04575 [Phototrophicaceae bacterium]|jgi:hypothetical protein|nr:hypothetical protein [Phototrophicaceae bacterium]